MKQFDHFKILAPFYEIIFKPPKKHWLFDLLYCKNGCRILDVGGGTGRISQSIIDDSEYIVVLDISMGMLNQLKSKNGLYGVCSNSSTLPFPDGFFDGVIMVDALHHVSDQYNTIQEIWRVTKDDGKVIIQEPDIGEWQVKIIAFLEKLLLMKSKFLFGDQITRLFPERGTSRRLIKEDLMISIIVEKQVMKG